MATKRDTMSGPLSPRLGNPSFSWFLFCSRTCYYMVPRIFWWKNVATNRIYECYAVSERNCIYEDSSNPYSYMDFGDGKIVLKLTWNLIYQFHWWENFQSFHTWAWFFIILFLENGKLVNLRLWTHNSIFLFSLSNKRKRLMHFSCPNHVQR